MKVDFCIAAAHGFLVRITDQDGLVFQRLLKCGRQETTCAGFHACYGGTWVALGSCRTGGTRGTCDGDRLVPADGDWAAFDCTTLGADFGCVASPQACCSKRCATDTEVTCDGTRGSWCTNGLQADWDCSPGKLTCSTKKGELCRGEGAACDPATYEPTCDGSVATSCEGGNVATFDCASGPLNRICIADRPRDPNDSISNPKPLCGPAGTECDELTAHECRQHEFTTCVDGFKVTVDCKAMGLGTCAVSADGDAYCRP